MILYVCPELVPCTPRHTLRFASNKNAPARPSSQAGAFRIPRSLLPIPRSHFQPLHQKTPTPQGGNQNAGEVGVFIQPSTNAQYLIFSTSLYSGLVFVWLPAT